MFASAAVAAFMHFLYTMSCRLADPSDMITTPRGALHMHAKLTHPLIGYRFRAGERVNQQCDTHSLPKARCRLSRCQQLLPWPQR